MGGQAAATLSAGIGSHERLRGKICGGNNTVDGGQRLHWESMNFKVIRTDLGVVILLPWDTF